LGASFGRGGATQSLQDMANADCIVIQGSNMAECHPVGFQWVAEAKARGAKIIHVDPRFTRTSAIADKHIPIRAGSDVVLLGALINHVLTNDLWFKEYVVAYTNAATLVNEDFRDTEDLGGLFSGFDPETGQYDPATWAYAEPGGDGVESPGGGHEHGASAAARAAGDEHGSGGPPLQHAQPQRDETLQHPHTVFQILKRHFARYTPEMVRDVCGIGIDDFAYLARAITENSGRERTTCFAYAVGWTQHTLGAQFIRTAAILQLLLGNVGRPGSGIMALRGHASIQGSTDIPTLFNLLAGYLPMPRAGRHDSLQEYLESIASKKQKGFWTDADAYTVSLLKAWWGDAAREDNDWAYDYLPRLTGPHGTYQTVTAMLAGQVEGYFLLGQNPAVGSANGRQQRLGMSHLKWLVVRDLNLIESATWWKDGPEIASGELRAEDIETEVFFLPAASHVEKAGSFTQTQRLLQWRHKAVEPPGDCQSELQFFFSLGQRIRQRLAGSTDERDRPLLDLTWDYRTDSRGDPDSESVLAEINGRYLAGPDAGQPLSSYTQMRADGSTAGGCWIYAGVYAGGVNRAASRVPHGGPSPSQSEWGWAWPANRRILYNRASADPDGNPWSERKKYVWWDAEQGRWVGNDVPDFVADRAPGSRPDPDLGGSAALAGHHAGRRQGLAVRAQGHGRRAAARALRAAGVAGGQRALPPAAKPGPDHVRAHRQPQRAERRHARRGRLPVCVHHLPAHRAPHRGRDEPLAALPVRIAAGDVLRGLARAGGRARPGELRLGHHHLAPRGDRGEGTGHRADDPADHPRPHRASGRAALPLGGGHGCRRQR